MIGEKKQNYFTVKDLSAAEFIQVYAQYLKKNNMIERPVWADYVKCGPRNELAPSDEDWIYIKVASLARKIYIRPQVGVRLLAHIYGGRKRGGCRPEKHAPAGTKIIRWGLHQLEKLKIIKKEKDPKNLKLNSRIISQDGQRALNRIVTEHIKARK